MTDFNQVLLSVLLVLCCVLVVFLIVVSIKLLYTTDKVNIILTDVEKKLNSVSGVFSLIDTVTDGLSAFSDVVFNRLVFIVEKFFGKKER